ncbi:hypothetical protein Pelo_4292 [Pelomyxa schiedti]|nr:hypothetical protein Pelo_4292 [Pelomyxa schiedti]
MKKSTAALVQGTACQSGSKTKNLQDMRKMEHPVESGEKDIGTPPRVGRTIICSDGEISVPPGEQFLNTNTVELSMDECNQIIQWCLLEGGISDELLVKASVYLNPHYLSLRLIEAMRGKEPPIEINAHIDSSTSEVEHYYRTGRAMAGSNKTLVELEKSIAYMQTLKCTPHTDKPFIILDGSSGMGKTQLAFALNEDVIYLVYDGETQDIYKCFTPLSASFCDCVARDSGELHKKGRFPHCNVLFGASRELWTIAWLDWCFSIEWDPVTNERRSRDALPLPSRKSSRQEYYPQRLPYTLLEMDISHKITAGMSRSRFLQKWSSLPKKPVIFIDEIPGKDQKEDLAFMRNLCLALDLTVILAGTNSRAVNMLSSSSSCTDVNKPYLWCHLFVRPSAPTVNTLQVSRVPNYTEILEKCRAIDQHLAQFVEHCAVTCRGLFVLAMFRQLETMLSCPSADLQGLSPLAILDDLFAGIREGVLAKKDTIYETNMGRAGQVLMYFSRMKGASGVISAHFAQLYIEGKNNKRLESHQNKLVYKFWRDNNMLVEESTREAVPAPLFAFFPSINLEPLLFLSLCGLKDNTSGFLATAQRRIPLCEAWSNPTLVEQLRAKISTQSVVGGKSDGSLLEQYAGVAIAAASYRGGLGGQQVLPYLTALAYHLYGLTHSLKFEAALKKQTVIPKNMQDIIIPALSPTDDPFPKYLTTIPGLHVQNLIRTADKCMIDIKGGNIIAEAKDRDEFVSSKVESVLRKFSHHATPQPQLCLIFQRAMNKKPYKLHTKGAIYQVRANEAQGLRLIKPLYEPRNTKKKKSKKETEHADTNTDLHAPEPDININGLCLIFEVGDVKTPDFATLAEVEGAETGIL